jgi:hypothetical protein
MRERKSNEYVRLHDLVRRTRGKARTHACEHCGGPALEWATIHERDGKDPMNDYMPLCRKCHAVYDDLSGAVSRAMTGRKNGPHKPETREKMRLAGLARWERWRAMTPEEQKPARERMSAGQRRRHQSARASGE